MNGFKYLFLILCVTLLFGCSPEKYTDVSNKKEYRSIIGTSFKTKVELLATGITFNSNYGNKVDYLFIKPKPGVSGPQVVFVKPLVRGAVFEIKGVLESKRLLGGNRILYIVKFSSGLFDKYVCVIKVFNDIDSANKGLDTAEYELKIIN